MTKITPDIQAANAKLLELRRLAQQNRASGDSTFSPPVSPFSPSPETAVLSVAAVSNLSWEERNTQAYISQLREQKRPLSRETGWLAAMAQRAGAAAADIDKSSDSCRQPAAAETVKLYPSLIAALDCGQAAQFRLWLALRHLDSSGRGWLDMLTIKRDLAQLLGLTCRRLRQTVNSGSGSWWKVDRDSRGRHRRIWLAGAKAVAARLGLVRLTGKPIALPVQLLGAGIGEFRAVVFAAWLAGKSGNPISQETARRLTGIPERTQRHYCDVAGIRRRANYAIGKRFNREGAEQAAWEHGPASFTITDFDGRQGSKNGRYNAWRLPNSYILKLKAAPKGRQQKINAKLADLVNTGAQGNGNSGVSRIFHPDGKTAAKAAYRQSGINTYWPIGKSNQAQLWGVIGGEKCDD